ncbi:tyrosine-type recombinase/integrase [Actinocatenispora sera]|uniref:Putative prophage phiRv2 integrase n=1 Tax=Actinocatenispora sera TaxID=390989 RepID=A0A810KUG4_9ACTN|nr:site-specific integrase [Actinocatenispora sera]BCJ26873.1 putative prophage phiRv2 integrase [Actinocatenispora sera]
MPNKEGHRHFGNVRKLPSGRFQVRYPGPDGRMRNGAETYPTRPLALRALAIVEGQVARGEWIDPERGKVLLRDYADRWIAQRPKLRPRTVDLYRWLLGKHIAPYLGGVPLSKLSTAMVREWRAELLGKGVSASMAAKAYRLLRAVLMTAVNEDNILPRNPCRIPGADAEDPAERPTLNVTEVYDLAAEMPDRFFALVLLATFASLRYGEVTALQRRDLDLSVRTVRVRQAFVERSGGVLLGPPKSRAGLRTVSIPASLVPELRRHLADYVGDDPDAWVFTGPKGAVLKRSNFNKVTAWKEAVTKIGKPGLHFHDLRHTGNTLAASSGASTRDLMARMGHDSMNAALIYQHATSEADRAIADALDRKLPGGGDDEPEDPPAGALVPAG